jgi:hypothetical protein
VQVLRLHPDGKDREKYRGCEFRVHGEFPLKPMRKTKAHRMIDTGALLEMIFKRAKSAPTAQIATGAPCGLADIAAGRSG